MPTSGQILPPITTDRLRLRPFVPDDLDAVHALWADPDVGRWLGGAHERLQESIDELQGHLDHQARHGYSLWAVEERSTDRLVGEVGLQRFEMRGPEVEVGWVIAREAWGRGYAREAAGAALAAGFEHLGVDEIVAVVMPENDRSRRVAEAIGMRERGRRQAYGAEHVEYVSARTP